MDDSAQTILQISATEPKQAVVLIGGGLIAAIVLFVIGHYVSRFMNKHVDPHVEKKAGEMVDRLRGKKDEPKKDGE